MGGVDKGLQPLTGKPLVEHALKRLRPQVGALAVNANRHLEIYAGLGLPVWPDALAGYPGPLAGILAGLEACTTPWLMTVPCDAPRFPLDLVARLADAAAKADADIAVPFADGRTQPVFCLAKASLAGGLREFMQGEERRVEAWLDRHHLVRLPFDDAAAFANVNTHQDLMSLEGTA